MGDFIQEPQRIINRLEAENERLKEMLDNPERAVEGEIVEIVKENKRLVEIITKAHKHTRLGDEFGCFQILNAYMEILKEKDDG